MSDDQRYLLEVGLGIIVIPFQTWIVVSIFALRQQVALIRAELGILKEIKDMLSRRTSKR